MRQILVDHARKRGCQKRGACERPVAFDETRVAIDRPDDLVALDDALVDLAKFDDRKARVIEFYYFGGLTRPSSRRTSGQWKTVALLPCDVSYFAVQRTHVE